MPIDGQVYQKGNLLKLYVSWAQQFEHILSKNRKCYLENISFYLSHHVHHLREERDILIDFFLYFLLGSFTFKHIRMGSHKKLLCMRTYLWPCASTHYCLYFFPILSIQFDPYLTSTIPVKNASCSAYVHLPLLLFSISKSNKIYQTNHAVQI